MKRLIQIIPLLLTLSVTGQINNPWLMPTDTFTINGNGGGGGPVEYDWDVTTLVYDGSSNVSIGQNTAVAFYDNGNKVLQFGSVSDNLYAHTVSIPYDATSTLTEIGFLDEDDGAINIGSGAAFNDDGSKIYFIGWANETIYEYPLSTNYDVTTSGTVYKLSLATLVGGTMYNTLGLHIKADGTRFWWTEAGSKRVYQANLSTPWDMSTATYDDYYTVSDVTNTAGIHFNPAGDQFLVYSYSSDVIFQYNLTTPWDVTGTVTADGSKWLSTNVSLGIDIDVSPDGSKVYISDHSGTYIRQFLMTSTEE